MAVYVMTMTGDCPVSYFEYVEVEAGSTPPWGFNGYVLMNATTAEAAEAEFQEEVKRFYARD